MFFQMRRLRPGGVGCVVQGHTVGGWRSWDSGRAGREERREGVEAGSLTMLAGTLNGCVSGLRRDGQSGDGEEVRTPRAKVVHDVGTRSLEVLIGGSYSVFVDYLSVSSVLLFLPCLFTLPCLLSWQDLEATLRYKGLVIVFQ